MTLTLHTVNQTISLMSKQLFGLPIHSQTRVYLPDMALVHSRHMRVTAARAPSAARPVALLPRSSYRAVVSSASSGREAQAADLTEGQHSDSLRPPVAAAAAVLASLALLLAPGPATADLNTLEADAGGEFGRGSAMQVRSCLCVTCGWGV